MNDFLTRQARKSPMAPSNVAIMVGLFLLGYSIGYFGVGFLFYT